MIQLHFTAGEIIKGYKTRAEFEALCEKMQKKKTVKITCVAGKNDKIHYFSQK